MSLMILPARVPPGRVGTLAVHDGASSRMCLGTRLQQLPETPAQAKPGDPRPTLKRKRRNGTESPTKVTSWSPMKAPALVNSCYFCNLCMFFASILVQTKNEKEGGSPLLSDRTVKKPA